MKLHIQEDEQPGQHEKREYLELHGGEPGIEITLYMDFQESFDLALDILGYWKITYDLPPEAGEDSEEDENETA